eukprot:NODE_882_length_1114_cov_122.350235_g719_i0.p1 GENE.NODE_882_length_1114_cov_122.350235_g719_i0~~NODE_882_length_1114_cov_122.350235_g719_i0.p1  ORF type:complete len:274 (+),score=36.26 NODE_882_length_1114_cov_122.350235_g719_i0:75-896(+)
MEPEIAQNHSQSAEEKKCSSNFRDYAARSKPSVEALYRENHEKQTLEFVLAKKAEFTPPRRKEMGVWECLELLDGMQDESDPDTSMSQMVHALQCAEAARAAGHPSWFQVVALIHDAGKMLNFFGEPQFAVVGDTFPVGCAFSEKIIFHEHFVLNKDSQDPILSTPNGIYEEHCGFDNVHFSWGHDEYLYHVVKDYLPEEAAYIIRYHSFYPHHHDGAYEHLMASKDHDLMKWVKKFQPFDLYSKADSPPDREVLKPYYQKLLHEFFPDKIWW